MTAPLHTEESLIVLADALLDDSQPYIRRELTHHSLRLAIREVLAEKDAQFRHAQAFAAIADRERERAEKAEAECERLRKDAARYRRLQILGVAPGGSHYLDNGTVLRFTNLDKYVDNDIAAHPSRGESTIEQAKCMTPTAADIEDAKDCMIDPAMYPGTVRGLLLRFVLREKP